VNGEPRLLHLLLVEDSDDDAELLLIELRRAGYELHHTRVETAEQMHEALRDNSWDVVISDYHLPASTRWQPWIRCTSSRWTCRSSSFPAQSARRRQWLP
jgi:DNA-binding response OmpR family regulator